MIIPNQGNMQGFYFLEIRDMDALRGISLLYSQRRGIRESAQHPKMRGSMDDRGRSKDNIWLKNVLESNKI
jgi:hypothetical protein